MTRFFNVTVLAFILFPAICTTVIFPYGPPRKTLVKIIVAPDHDNWLYKTGEEAEFSISVIKYGNPIKKVPVEIEIGPVLEKAAVSKSMVLDKGSITMKAGTLEKPGMLRCKVFAKVDGKSYSDMATAGFSVDKIKPATELPSDFMAFWKKAIKKASKVPFEATRELVPEQCTDKSNAFHISFQNERPNSRIYGILSIPKKPGKYPALVNVPGYGIRSYWSYSRAEYITLKIGVHGLPVTLPDEVYASLIGGALRDYLSINTGDREYYYMKRVILGCVRAIDYLYTLPEFDKKKLLVRGSSQGGALAIITGALNPRVKRVASFFPAFADMKLNPNLYLNRDSLPEIVGLEDKINTLQYYDVVNFARFLKAPLFFSFGHNEPELSPASMYAVYNTVKGPKELSHLPGCLAFSLS